MRTSDQISQIITDMEKFKREMMHLFDKKINELNTEFGEALSVQAKDMGEE